MLTKRSFAIAIAAMLVIGAAVASAQSAGAWTKSSNAGSIAGKGPAVSAPSQENSPAGFPPRLEGTWQVTQTFSDHDDVGLYTFSAGSDANNGTVVWQDQYVFTANPSCINGQGGWKRTGGHSYIGTQISFCFDADNGFVPAGYLKIRYSVRTNNQGTSLSGDSVFEGYDTDGHLVFSATATLQGTRMPVQGAQ